MKESADGFEGILLTSPVNHRLYLQAVLRQNVAFFDRLGAGEVTSRVSSDAELVREGISDKVHPQLHVFNIRSPSASRLLRRFSPPSSSLLLETGNLP